MSLPPFALLLFLLVVAVVPAGWAVRRWLVAHRQQRQRQQLEDALKHLFEQEYRDRAGTMASLSGALRLADGAVVALVGRMQARELVTTRGAEVRLTPDGERLALQVVRAHRLLERYFADEARLPLSRVHAAAERDEHRLSPEAADRLSASLGHPAVDPHGDPIPGRDGTLSPPSGTPTTDWPVDTPGRVAHLEDEPEISYAQIAAEGIRLGQVLRIVETSPERIVLSDGESEFRLAPAVAANVFLEPAQAAARHGDVVPLSRLATDEDAEVVTLDAACQGFSRRRLMDLGFTEGTRTRPVLQTFAGDPRGYEVRGTLIALRREQADQILVRPVARPPAALTAPELP